ncbi:MAG: phospholipase, partial [Chloroflexi bacterium]|nr:phospholipase [Chloroflexota bacterium]
MLLVGCSSRTVTPPSSTPSTSTSRTLTAPATSGVAPTTPSPVPAGGISKIRHVVVIMQENRSFDSYFGTFPGADGIPAAGGRFTVCVPDPATKGCDPPFHDPAFVNGGAGHSHQNAVADADGGRMDGFVAEAERSSRGCPVVQDPACAQGAQTDVMGYHD